MPGISRSPCIVRVLTKPRLQSYWAEARNCAGADSRVTAAGADEVFDGPATLLTQGISLLVGTAAWEDEHVETREAIGAGPHVFGAEDLPGARRDGPQNVNERLGLIAARLLVKDAGVDGAYDRGGFRERLNQLALLGWGGWPACLGGETELMRLDCGERLDRRRLAQLQSWR